MPSEFENSEPEIMPNVDDILSEFKEVDINMESVEALDVPVWPSREEITEVDDIPLEIPQEKEEKKRSSISGELYSWAQDLVTCLIFIVIMFIFVIRIIGVDGSSMVPTLEDSDMLALLSNVLYTPKTGDIVVVQKKEFSDQPIVKRIIATAGQTVDIDFDTGEVRVDGVLQDEPFISETTHRAGDVQYPVTVPEGCLFVMGDNRNNSTDSRWSMIGMIDERCVLGKALMIVFPFNHFGRVS